MFSRILLIFSACMLGVLGVSLSFFPQEILQIFDQDQIPFTNLILQIAGSLYLGLAILNWMSKNTIIGGVYGRPILIINLIHFMSTSIILVKFSVGMLNAYLLILATFYIMITFAFIVAFMTNPVIEVNDIEEVN
ncbi:hypothetical protein [Namhaeicola litoreus]|uniref:Uncharacterized protein n=1 Tax=Namhaeicola litoreus TaxID=1052145 RepID=A0ABW3Y3A5_9FLAO